MAHRGRSIWFTLHRWLGIGLGLWFVLVGLTGALHVYRDAIDTWLNPALLRPRSPGPPLEPSAVVERARQMDDLGRIERVRLPGATTGSTGCRCGRWRAASNRAASRR